MAQRRIDANVSGSSINYRCFRPSCCHLYGQFNFHKKKLTRATLRNHLDLLQIRFEDSAIVDAEVERREIEKLINEVKVACPQHVISHDIDLKTKLNLAYRRISSIASNRVDVSKTSWIKLRAVAYDFGDLYFPGFAK